IRRSKRRASTTAGRGCCSASTPPQPPGSASSTRWPSSLPFPTRKRSSGGAECSSSLSGRPRLRPDRRRKRGRPGRRPSAICRSAPLPCAIRGRSIRGALRDLPGELIERPWVDFAHNRNQAIDLAAGRADYLFFIDADEVLVLPDGFRVPELTADAYDLEMRTSRCSYIRRQLVRAA